jgi:biotin-(acetyl-CoA carboxylase) ligase
MKDNVVDFSKASEKRNKRDEEIEELVLESNKEVADIFAIVNARETVWALRGMGIDVENDPKSMLDIMTIIEASKSLVYRSIGEEYPFQQVSGALFEDAEDKIEQPMQKILDDFIENMEEYFDGIDDD